MIRVATVPVRNRSWAGAKINTLIAPDDASSPLSSLVRSGSPLRGISPRERRRHTQPPNSEALLPFHITPPEDTLVGPFGLLSYELKKPDLASGIPLCKL